MIEILFFPVATSIDFALSTSRHCVVVGPPVQFSFFHEALLDKRIEVRIQATVVDLFFLIFPEFVFDRKPVRIILADNCVQKVPLEACQIVHTLVSTRPTNKYNDTVPIS